MPYRENEASSNGCTDDIDWDCDGFPKCDDPDCAQELVCTGGGGGGGEPQPGLRYCVGSYEGTDWEIYDLKLGTWSYAYTTWEYSVSCYLLDRPGLHKAPLTSNTTPEREKWRIVELNEPEWRRSLSTRRLFIQSSVVAIGETIRNVSARSQDGNHVTTNYYVRLIEVLKGDPSPEATISVTMPGGWVTEENGVILDARAHHVRKLVNGKKYVMFLKNLEGQDNSFTPIRGSQGLYELPASGARVFHLGRAFDLPPHNDGELVSVFLQQVRSFAYSQ